MWIPCLRYFREWKARGYETNGIYHSHPIGAIRPSYHDISTALLHLRFFDLDYFYLPILQSNRKGYYTLYSYVVRRQGGNLNVNLEYVIQTKENGYKYISFAAWSQEYAIAELDAYRERIDHANNESKNAEMTEYEPETIMTTEIKTDEKGKKDIMKDKSDIDTAKYFQKVKGLYPDHVLDKPLIFVGAGGARSAIINFARCGFRNYILIEADTVSATNIATQAVYISEMGKKKVQVIREEILDVNPEGKSCMC